MRLMPRIPRTQIGICAMEVDLDGSLLLSLHRLFFLVYTKIYLLLTLLLGSFHNFCRFHLPQHNINSQLISSISDCFFACVCVCPHLRVTDGCMHNDQCNTPTTQIVRIKSFSGNTVSDVKAAVERFKSKGVSRIVVDLRGNVGGLLPAGIDTAGLFLDAGKVRGPCGSPILGSDRFCLRALGVNAPYSRFHLEPLP